MLILHQLMLIVVISVLFNVESYRKYTSGNGTAEEHP